MVGNHNSGRKPKYLTVEAFEKWTDNDSAHLIKRVNFQDLKVNFLLGFMAIILTLLAIIMVMTVWR